MRKRKNIHEAFSYIIAPDVVLIICWLDLGVLGSSGILGTFCKYSRVNYRLCIIPFIIIAFGL